MLKGNDVICILADCAVSAVIIRLAAAIKVGINLFIWNLLVITTESQQTKALLKQTVNSFALPFAEHLVRDARPGLDDRAQQDEELANAQMELKSRIKAMQLRDPSKTFRQCWESLQRSDPQLFEELPESA